MQKLLIFVSAFVLISGTSRAQETESFSTPAAQQAFVNQRCAGCHNDKLKSGSFNWKAVDLTKPGQSAENIEKAIHILRAGMMPPPGIPRPAPAVLAAFTKSLETSVDQAASQAPNAGAPALHRLNRTEYRNSIKDLLALDVDATTLLPADDKSHGFDNMADALGVSPALMEGYIRAASKISREAVGDRNVAATTANYHLARVINQMRHVEGTPFGTRGGMSVTHDFPADGEYIFRLSLYYDICGPLWGKNQGKGQQVEVSVDGKRVALISIDPNSTFTDDLITPPIRVTAGPKNVSAAFIMKAAGPVEDTVMPFEQSLIDFNLSDMPGVTSLPHLREMRVVGPQKVTGISDTPSRKKIFSCRPAPGADEIPCAKQIISQLVRQAYRRPVKDSDTEDLLSVYQQGHSAPAKNEPAFEAGIRTVIQTLIADPEFVFRFEHNDPNAAPGTNYRISDLELASRLSFFLWSSGPDEQLISLASQGKLKDPTVLNAQVKRMLADPRSVSLSKVFANQWLTLQNLNEVQPEAFLFPNFDKNLGDSMREETERFFDSIVREDHNILDLLTADYTFVDELLAKHYGIPDVLGTRFRRVKITDPNRYGLLGQASILTLTSVSNRTSPVQRGKWVMISLLGSPPPPPPPVPALKEIGENEAPHTVRELMEQHRKNEPCASCHKLMDPIGLALENFDGIGQWRTKDLGLPLDTRGQMYDGAVVDGPISLRNALMKHSDAFIGTFTESFLAYALGRVVDYPDMPQVRQIEMQAAKDNNKFSAYVLAIVNSMPFQMRRAEGRGTATASLGGASGAPGVRASN